MVGISIGGKYAIATLFFRQYRIQLYRLGIVAARYIWPELRLRQRAEALRPLLILHSFRFIGLAFLVPGVVSPDLSSAFAQSAAYGDIMAAILALLALISLSGTAGIVIAWIFRLWGTADLFNAFYQANYAGLMAGQLGATYFIPTVIVPLLLITHGLAFRILLQHQPQPKMQEKPARSIRASRNFSRGVKKEGRKVEAAAAGRAIVTHLSN